MIWPGCRGEGVIRKGVIRRSVRGFCAAFQRVIPGGQFRSTEVLRGSHLRPLRFLEGSPMRLSWGVGMFMAVMLNDHNGC